MEIVRGNSCLTNYLYAEINIVGVMVLLLILTNKNGASFTRLPFDQQIFNGVMLLNLLIFLFDTGMWLSDGGDSPGLRLVNYAMTTLYYLLNPLICFLWLLYTDYKIHESKSGLFRRARVYAVPVIISSVMTLASPIKGWFFVISQENRYARGPLFAVMATISCGYLLLSCSIALVDILKNGWEKNKSVIKPLIIFPIGVIAATAIQIRFFGLSVIWVCSMLACTSIYINIQNAEVSTDHLTGLYNRRRLDQYLQRRIQMRHGSCLLFAVILDLDEFKLINDNCGHMKGDEVLIHTAELLRQSCSPGEDFIARLGGDEFIIVGERSCIGEIESLTQRINSDVAEYNRTHPSKYPLKLSMGYSVFRGMDTEDSFLAAADQRMYRCKQKHREVPPHAASN